MRQLLCILLTFSLVGCAAEPRVYHARTNEYPVTLTLNPDGQYRLGHVKRGGQNWRMVNEDGRWREFDRGVVMLLPDNLDWPTQYARVSVSAESEGAFQLFRDPRSAIDAPQTPLKTDQPPLSPWWEEHFARSADSAEEKQKLRRLIYRLENPFIITEEQYKSLTTYPYSRVPFLHDPLLSETYYNAYRKTVPMKTKHPGALYFYPGSRFSRVVQRLEVERNPNDLITLTMWDAAHEAGWHAGMISQTEQLTAEERREIERWKQNYWEVMTWPGLDLMSSHHSRMLEHQDLP